MEDRYLFKGKRLDNGEWVQGYQAKGLDVFDIHYKEVHVIFELNTMFYSRGETDGWCEVDPSTICQCTGLKDKNGKWIWENDVVRDGHGNLYKVFWQNNYYQFSWICVKSDVLIGSKLDLWDFKSFEIEVIGNIFDNPELLESEG